MIKNFKSKDIKKKKLNKNFYAFSQKYNGLQEISSLLDFHRARRDLNKVCPLYSADYIADSYFGFYLREDKSIWLISSRDGKTIFKESGFIRGGGMGMGIFI